MTHLFDPLAIRDITFANRVFVSPMCQYSRSCDRPKRRRISEKIVGSDADMNFSPSLIKLLNDEVADLPASAEHEHSRLAMLRCCPCSSDLSFSKALPAVRGITFVLAPMMVCPMLS